MNRIELAAAAAGVLLCCAGPSAARTRGLLPSNQRVTPAGKQINLGLFPSGMVLSPDGSFVFITNNGFLSQSLMTLNTATLRTKEQGIAPGFNTLFQGIALTPDGKTGFASAGGSTDSQKRHIVRTVTFSAAGNVLVGPSIPVSDPISPPSYYGTFPAGMAVSPDGQRLYVALNLAGSLGVIDVASKTMLTTVPVGLSPWSVAVHPTRHEVYVTNRGDQSVSVVDTDTNQVRASVATGSNPSAVAVTPDGSKVFVADANSDDLTVFDPADLGTVRTISLTPFDGARPGASPSALAISPDGNTVYVALAWENAVAVVDAHTEALRGYIPTGVYPSAIVVSPDSQKLYIANMKGARTYPRTPDIQSFDYTVNILYGGTYGVPGTLSVLPVPSPAKLHGYTRRVMFDNGYLTGARPSNQNQETGPCYPIPCTAEDVTPIKHVFFIVKENKTYDEDLGDLPQGDGDPSLTLFPRYVTPNTHALVEEFVLMDRFFANSEKSEPGHNWTMGAIDTDYGERTWLPVSYQLRPDDLGSHLSSSTGDVIRGTVGPIAVPEGGFWFDNCHDHGVTFRNYGEFLRVDSDGNPIDYWAANTNFDFAVFNLRVTDVSRYQVWAADFAQQVADGTVPQFTYIALPNDHNNGREAGYPTPEAYVADNDFALGKIVETISNATDIWKQSAIFVLEDDSQSGGDHVDSHRTVGTVISPWVSRHAVIHTRYDMASMHRTMELILGLPPMSIFDQMAIVMRDVFTDTPDYTPYTALPQNIPIDVNPPGTSGAVLSSQYDFSRPDRVPDAVLNKILWDYFTGRETGPNGNKRSRLRR